MQFKKNVLLALSGGVDSSVAAILLKDKGYNVIAVTFDFCGMAEKDISFRCFCDKVLNNAANVAKKLNIEHHVLNVNKQFQSHVISVFLQEYLSGRTPNPCVRCNFFIKWDQLIQQAQALKCDFIATGHYVRIVEVNERFLLKKGIDNNKDQSYFLWRLDQHSLKKTIFPLGNHHKAEIKKIAQDNKLGELSNKKESQEICFITDNNYRTFLKNNAPEKLTEIGEGDVVSTTGEKLGRHNGYPFYTIGQRRGLNIAVGKPRYVVSINPETNTIVLGKKDDLQQRKLVIKDINLIKYNELPDDLKVTTKIRYNNKGTMSSLVKQGDKIKIAFESPVESVTPGQSAVFYEDEDVVGGGVIV